MFEGLKTRVWVQYLGKQGFRQGVGFYAHHAFKTFQLFGHEGLALVSLRPS